MNTFYSLQAAFALIATALFAEAQQTADTADTADAACGLAALANELQQSPDLILGRCYAIVESSVAAPAPEIADRPIGKARSNYVVERASRITYKLRSVGLGKPVGEEDRTVIAWTHAYAARIRDSSFSSTYTNPRASVIGHPLQQGKLVSFDPDLPANPGESPTMIVLPSDSTDMIKEAHQWRTANAGLFGAEATNQEVIATLRAATKSVNPYQRLVALLRLQELQRLTSDDIAAAINVAKSTTEVAAITLAILNRSPENATSLITTSIDAASNSFVLDGVALGAATHFLTLPNSDELLRKANTSQFTDLAPSDDRLKKTVSFTLLQQLGKQASEQAKQRSPILSRMLNVTGASAN